MIRDTDGAFVNQLVDVAGTDTIGEMNVPNGTSTLSVPITFGNVEDFLKSAEKPALNILRLPLQFDSSRFQVGFHERLSADELSVNRTDFMHPYNVAYQIDFLTQYQGHMVLVLEAILRRIKPLGFGSYITVNDMMFPYRLSDQSDLTDYETTDDREFRYTLTYVVEGWFGHDLTETNTKTVHEIDISVEEDK